MILNSYVGEEERKKKRVEWSARFKRRKKGFGDDRGKYRSSIQISEEKKTKKNTTERRK